MGMKNIFEVEGVIDLRDSCFSFLSRSIPFFPVTTVEISPKMEKMFIVEDPFIEELSGMAMVKILDMKEQTTNMIKLKFIRNKAVLKIMNNTQETITFGRREMMGIVDLRSLLQKIKQVLCWAVRLLKLFSLIGNMSRGNLLCICICTAIHNCSSSGSLFFATFRQNN